MNMSCARWSPRCRGNGCGRGSVFWCLAAAPDLVFNFAEGHGVSRSREARGDTPDDDYWRSSEDCCCHRARIRARGRQPRRHRQRLAGNDPGRAGRHGQLSVGICARQPRATVVLPLLATQLLWINLVTDGAPALALGVDPADPALMQQPPRTPHEGVLTRPMLGRNLLRRCRRRAWCTRHFSSARSRRSR